MASHPCGAVNTPAGGTPGGVLCCLGPLVHPRGGGGPGGDEAHRHHVRFSRHAPRRSLPFTLSIRDGPRTRDVRPLTFAPALPAAEGAQLPLPCADV